MRMMNMGRNDRHRPSLAKEQSLDENLAKLRRNGKEKLSEMRDREMEMFMTPGQRKRESIRRGKRRAKMEDGFRKRDR
jgi:hypothetical protein